MLRRRFAAPEGGIQKWCLPGSGADTITKRTDFMSGIIDSLRSDHSRMTKLLDALERQIGAFEEGGVLDFEIANGVLHYCRSYPDRHHHPCEDLVFDRLKRRNAKAAAEVGDLRREHSKLVALTEAFAESLDAVEQDVPMERLELVAAARAFLAQIQCQSLPYQLGYTDR